MIRKVRSTKSIDMISLLATGELIWAAPAGHTCQCIFVTNPIRSFRALIARNYSTRNHLATIAICRLLLHSAVVWRLAQNGFFFQLPHERGWVNTQNFGSLGFVVSSRA